MGYKTRGVYSCGGGEHFAWCKCLDCRRKTNEPSRGIIEKATINNQKEEEQDNGKTHNSP